LRIEVYGCIEELRSYLKKGANIIDYRQMTAHAGWIALTVLSF
jgi:hypothetical protein